MTRTNRRTGAQIAVVDNRAGDFEGDRDEAGRVVSPWYTVCDTHGALIAHSSRRLAVQWAAYPDDWCEGCRQVVGD
jgi:hypothetical protein